MIKMGPYVVSIVLLTVLSLAHADVSHLNGYRYANFGAHALHTPQSPPPTQYHSSYGDNLVSAKLPDSYQPPPSGSPFDSVAPIAKTYSTQRLSAPQQSPLLAAQKYPTQTTYQQTQPQQQRYYPASNYQRTAYQAPAPTLAPIRPTQGPLITKHFYVHAAPEDPEEQTQPRFVQVGRARKTYKIIFIKAPTYAARAQIIPVIPPNEEKTIVYVLSKKPTFEQNIQLPEPPVTEPSKPDVFFIKYRNQKEADQAQQSIQAAYDQANLASADSADQVASQFLDTNSGSTAFGGQDSTQQNQYGGQYTSAT